jgi:hypothetical protein
MLLLGYTVKPDKRQNKIYESESSLAELATLNFGYCYRCD